MSCNLFDTKIKDVNNKTIKYDIDLVEFEYIDPDEGRTILRGTFRFNCVELRAQLEIRDNEKYKRIFYNRHKMSNFKIIKNNGEFNNV